MIFRSLFLPLALVAGSAVAAVEASAAPMSASRGPALLGGRVHVGAGVGVDIPIHGGSTYGPSHVVQPSGYWTTVSERIWQPGQLIGYDRFGQPIMSQGQWQVVQRQVWVPQTHVVHYQPRRYYRRPFGNIHIGLGGRWRIR